MTETESAEIKPYVELIMEEKRTRLKRRVRAIASGKV